MHYCPLVQCLGSESTKYLDSRIRIPGVKYQPKTANKHIMISKPKYELLKKKRLYIFLSLDCASSFRKKLQKIFFINSSFVQKISKSYRNVPDPFISTADPGSGSNYFHCGSRIRIKIKWITAYSTYVQ